ncbi:LPS assembly lipoprotein LptE [Campylobacter ureolyticus]|uniref:LPS assembly lipoprotein LptE n=1 Tax=Campylobacter ureolyticus TaxID=827 RepID=UPI0022B3C6DE|nr:LPS assembly lipoprotein LptE [Campylobacter ureolyticus]MCZ6150277.1 LPS assembly lipoprotein LptE [Campylobacter ureolyticus]
MKKIALFLALFFMVGCSYKPVSKITSDILGDSIFVDAIMSKTDPQNTVAIKDAVREGVAYRLHKKLAPRNIAQSYIEVSINSLNFSALTYDQYGYVTSYRANLSLNFKTKLKDGRVINLKGAGDHDFRVTKLLKSVRDTSSVISDQERYSAIQNASLQAFDEFIAALSIEGLKNENHENIQK